MLAVPLPERRECSIQAALRAVGSGSVSLDFCYRKHSENPGDWNGLLEALQQSTTLLRLHVAGFEVCEEGMPFFSSYLTGTETLRVLHISHTIVSSTAAQSLAMALQVNSSLVELAFVRARVPITGVLLLLGALKQNSSITSFSLQQNRLDHVAVAEVAEVLRQNRVLSKLELIQVGVTDGHVKELAEALRENTSLTELNLGSNPFSHSGACRFLAMLRMNRTLLTFLPGMALTQPLEEAIARRLAKNRGAALVLTMRVKRLSEGDFSFSFTKMSGEVARSPQGQEVCVHAGHHTKLWELQYAIEDALSLPDQHANVVLPDGSLLHRRSPDLRLGEVLPR